MNANFWIAHNVIAGQRDGQPYYLNVKTGEESLSPPPLPGRGSSDERSSKRRRPSLQGGGGEEELDGSSFGDAQVRPPVLLHARTVPSASNWVAGKQEGRDCFFNVITKESTFSPPPMPHNAAAVFAAATAIDMAVSPRGQSCDDNDDDDSPRKFLGGTMSLSPRSPLGMESDGGEGSSLFDDILVDDVMLLALEAKPFDDSRRFAPRSPSSSPSSSLSCQSAGEDSHGAAASVAALAGASLVSAIGLAAVPAAAAAARPSAKGKQGKAGRGEEKAKGKSADETAALRRVKNRKAASRCRQKKASRVQELEVKVSGLDATVSTLQQQLAASATENSALKSQLAFLRGLLITFAQTGGNGNGKGLAAQQQSTTLLAKSLVQ